MARRGRSQVWYKLRRPVVVGASVVFRRVKVALADPNRARVLVVRRGPHSKLRRPTVVGPSVVFSPVRVYRADPSRPAVLVLQRGPHSRLRTPTVVAPPAVPFVAAPVRVELTRPTRLPYASHAQLEPPVVVAASVTFPPVETRLARTPQQAHRTISELRPPVVLGASVVFAAIRTRLVEVPVAYLRTPLSRLRPPATLVQAVTGFVAPVLRLRLVRAPQAAFRAVSRLRAPVVVGSSVTFAPVRVKLAAQPRPPRVSGRLFELPPAPVVLTLDQTRLRAKFAPRVVPPATHSLIRKPTVVSRPVLPEQQFLRVTFAYHPTQGRVAHAVLREPSVVGPFVNPATLGFFDQPTPDSGVYAGTVANPRGFGFGDYGSGVYGGSGHAAIYDPPSPTDNRYGSHPASGQYDAPTPTQVSS